jgi:hypothetical protein
VACIPLSTSFSISPNKTRVEASKWRDRYSTHKFLELLEHTNTCVCLEDRRCLGRVLEQALSASPIERFKHNSIAKKDKSSPRIPFLIYHDHHTPQRRCDSLSVVRCTLYVPIPRYQRPGHLLFCTAKCTCFTERQSFRPHALQAVRFLLLASRET